MIPRNGRIGLILAALIVSGGVLVALLNYSSFAGTSSSGQGVLLNGSVTVPIQGGANNVYGTAASTITMTTTATAALPLNAASSSGLDALSSSFSGSGSSTIVLNAGGQELARGPAAQPRPTVSASRSVEFFSNITLHVSTPSVALDRASAIAYSLGGYVAYSTLMNSTAFVVLRVPAQNYQTALSQVESLGIVVGAVSTSNDVTVKYTDLNATLASLATEQSALLKLLNQSTSVNATLHIESIIQGVNAQLNEVQSEILQTQRLISYGTISVGLEKLVVPSPPKPLALKLTATPRSGMSPLSVTFNAIASGGSALYIVNYNFGDGTSSQGQTLIHTFGQGGEYNVTATATDSTGNVSEAWTRIKVAGPPVASGLATFPGFVGDLFLQVIEGIVEVAVVVLPLAAVGALVVLPLRRRFGAHQRQDKAPQTSK